MIFKTKQKEFPEIKKIKPLERETKFRKRKAGPKLPDGRWTIVSLFLLTALASLFFYLKAEVPIWWQRFASPAVISSLPEGSVFDSTPVLKEVEDLTRDLRGTYGVFIYRLEDNHQYGLNEKVVFPAASLIKLPVLITLYQQAEKEEINLNQKYVLAEKDKVGGAGILQNKKAGMAYTYRQLAEYMGQYSDNTAFKVIRGILGDQIIEATIKNMDMVQTSLAENKTTPADIGLLFQKLYQGELVTKKHRDEILGFLTETGFEDRIPAGVPEEIRVAHKIGTEMGSFSDAGIVFSPPAGGSAGGFVLAILSKDARESEALEVLPKIAKSVFDFETEGN